MNVRIYLKGKYLNGDDYFTSVSSTSALKREIDDIISIYCKVDGSTPHSQVVNPASLTIDMTEWHL